MMGAGIAHATATQGIEVVLKDLSLAQAERGKAHSGALLDHAVRRGRLDEAGKAEVLSRIQPTDTAEDLSGCELIIEAVFEDGDLKASVTREAEPYLASGGLFASNTSTIPITQLARASARPDHFIGLHFFSPVDQDAAGGDHRR